MKEIKLQQLKLINFKGIRERTVDFNTDGITTISGRNRSGKTTVFDAFVWVLFGKDSQDRKAFDIKTIDPRTEEVIPQMSHEVEATLIVDGVKTVIKRTYNEKWVKNRGESRQTFEGHEEQRYWNEVPLTQKEFDSKRDNIIQETTFKMITSPFYFVNQGKKIQRETLLRMWGEVDDADIANGNKDFEAFLSDLNGKIFEEFVAEIASKKRKLKDELNGMPQRIDEARRAIPEVQNEEDLDNQLKEKEEEIKAIDDQLRSEVAKAEAKASEMLQLVGKASEIRMAQREERQRIRMKLQDKYYRKKNEQDELRRHHEKLRKKLENAPRMKEAELSIVQPLERRIEELREEFREITQRKQIVSPDAFLCPTCGVPFDTHKQEETKRMLEETFNKKQAVDKARNNEEGKSYALKIKEARERIAEIDRITELTKKEIEELEEYPLLTQDLGTPPEVDSHVSDKYQELLRQEAEVQEAIEALKGNAQGDSELEKQKTQLTKERDLITARINSRKQAEKQATRVAELEKEFETLNDELAKLEQKEFVAQEFQRAKVTSLEDKINSLFKTVKWRMYKEQINGGWEETCDPMVNGVSYPSVNNADQINAGIDIANTIAICEGVTAPIFIDNKEAVNEVMPTASQQVHLVVTDGDFRVTYNN